MLEKLADVDEEIAELYLMEEDPPLELLKAAIRRQTVARNFVPVCMGRCVRTRTHARVMGFASSAQYHRTDWSGLIAKDHIPAPLDCLTAYRSTQRNTFC